MTAPVSRDNELTHVRRRSRFDDCPGDVTSATDHIRWAIFRQAYHQAQQLFESNDFPLQLDFEINSSCNLRCGFCIHGNELVERRTLPRDLYMKAILEGEKYGLVSVKLNYINEPLIVSNLPDMIAFAKKHGVLNVYFATNGTLLTESMSERLIDAKLSKLMVSLDAATPETFEVMRQSKKFGLIVENIKRFIAMRDAMGLSWPLVRVNFLKTHLNIHEVDQFTEQWDGIADMLGFQDQVGMPGIENDWVEASSTMRQPLNGFRCSFPFKLMVIDSGGQILPCCTFSGREIAVGNIRDMAIAEAWNHPRVRWLRELHEEEKWREFETCAHCVAGTEGE